ncbi:MAG: DUF4177 domain-containing protein [Clostridia bacterium]|nr:DUF4177 domain-containing protein [Clostridia bacterium]
MKKYEYERIHVEIKAGFLENKLKDDYFEIIQREAALGWRLVDIFSPGVGCYGASSWVDLIFEREC